MAFQSRRPFNSNNQDKKAHTYTYQKPEHYMIWQTEERKAQILQAEIQRAAAYNKAVFPDLRQDLYLKEAVAKASAGSIPQINVGFVCFYHYMEGNSLREILLVESKMEPATEDGDMEIPQTMKARVSQHTPATQDQLQHYMLDCFQRSSLLPKRQLAVIAIAWTYAAAVTLGS